MKAELHGQYTQKSIHILMTISIWRMNCGHDRQPNAFTVYILFTCNGIVKSQTGDIKYRKYSCSPPHLEKYKTINLYAPFHFWKRKMHLFYFQGFILSNLLKPIYSCLLVKLRSIFYSNITRRCKVSLYLFRNALFRIIYPNKTDFPSLHQWAFPSLGKVSRLYYVTSASSFNRSKNLLPRNRYRFLASLVLLTTLLAEVVGRHSASHILNHSVFFGSKIS